MCIHEPVLNTGQSRFNINHAVPDSTPGRINPKEAFMRFYKPHTKFYCGVDLHARDIYICITGQNKEAFVHRSLANKDTQVFLKILAPCMISQSERKYVYPKGKRPLRDLLRHRVSYSW